MILNDFLPQQKQLYSLLQRAVEKFQDTMKEAMKGYGCDRHLLGLYLTAVEQALELPELFIDPSFVKSGGGGNYILSTSCKYFLSLTLST